MKKKVLIHTLIFSPDGVSTAYLYNDIALRFQKEGYEVIVLSTTPHFNVVKEQLDVQPMKWKVWGVYKESDFHGIRVIHVPQKKFKSTALRVLGFVYWHIISFILGLCIRNVDVIVSPSPPLSIGVLNLIIGKLKGCKVVYNVQEIYPDILKKKDGLVIDFLKKMERLIYNNSAAITTIDDVFYNTIVGRFKDPSTLHIIPNFVDTDLYKPVSADFIDERLFPRTDSLKLLYAGNIGHMQDWKPLVALAERTRNENIEYFVIGMGAQRDWLETQKKEKALEKLHVLDYQPREMIPNIIAYSDLQFIFMDPKSDMMGFPSKVYTIMACAKPLLICSGKGTPIINFTEKHGCAKIVTETDIDKKVEEMAEWLRTVSREELVRMGQRGYDVIQKHYTKDIVTKRYVDLVASIL